MTHYLLSVHGAIEIDEFGNYGSQEAMEAAHARVGVFNEQLQAGGHWVFAGGLEQASTANVVDGRGESPVITDGPYLESKEFLGGFWVIDAESHDAAMDLAVQASRACGGQVEIRPFAGLS